MLTCTVYDSKLTIQEQKNMCSILSNEKSRCSTSNASATVSRPDQAQSETAIVPNPGIREQSTNYINNTQNEQRNTLNALDNFSNMFQGATINNLTINFLKWRARPSFSAPLTVVTMRIALNTPTYYYAVNI